MASLKCSNVQFVFLSCSHILCVQHWQYFIFNVFSHHHQQYACTHDLLLQCPAYTIPHCEVRTASSTCKGSCNSTSFSPCQATPTGMWQLYWQLFNQGYFVPF